MIPLLVAKPRERSVEALPLKRDHQDPFRGRNRQHLVSGLNLQEFSNLLVQDNPIPIIHPQHSHYSSHNTNVSPTIKSFLSQQLGPYNQIGRLLTQEYTWSVGLSTLVISTIPGFSLSILAQCLPVSLALSVDDSCKHLGSLIWRSFRFGSRTVSARRWNG